jgi:signal transduction histidine kinase
MEQFPRGIAVFDEVNRVEQQTRQAYMQILDRRAIGNVRIPPGWVIVQTANPTDEGYQVSDFDFALLRRSNVQELVGDLEFWINWAQKDYVFDGEPMHPKILSTAMRLTNRGLVRSVDQKIKPFPTFAGLTKANEMLRRGAGALAKETRTSLYAGMIGAEAASILESSMQSDVLTKLLEKVMNGERIKASMEEMLDLSFLLLDKARKSPAKHAKILHTFYGGVSDEQKPMFARSCYAWFAEHRDAFKDMKADWREWCKQHMNLLKAAMDGERE